MNEPVEPPPAAATGVNLAVVGAVVAIVLGLGLVVGAVARSSSGSDSKHALERSTDEVDPGGGTTAPTTPAVGLGEGWAPERDGRTPLRGFGEAAVTITTDSGEVCRVCLLAATTADQRARGLMEITDRDLGGYDGMVFEYPEPVDGQFYMRNTPMPLSIAFFDADGSFVSSTDMAPCQDLPDCPSYPAAAPFTYAVEVPQGLLAEIGATEGSTLRLDTATCPVAAGS